MRPCEGCGRARKGGGPGTTSGVARVVPALAARGFAPHGEAWGAALCLRLGLAGAIQAETGELPVLFLDDPFSGLDPERRRRVAETLDGRGQVMMAVPDDAQIP